MYDKKSLSIVVSAAFTAEPLKQSLAYWLRELSIPADIKFAPYKQIFQQMLSESSLFAKNSNGINILLLRLHDLQKTAISEVSSGIKCAEIQKNIDEFIEVAQSSINRIGSLHLFCLCPPTLLPIATNDNIRIAHMEQSIASQLNGFENVVVLTSNDLLQNYLELDCYDPIAEKAGDIPYNLSFYSSLGTVIARHVFALKTKPYKVIVLDCDQTLWNGICAEDGPQAITLDEPHLTLQKFMLDQYNSGKLLCLCSKNNEYDVFAVFDRYPKMPLNRSHFISTRINWNSKVDNLVSLAEELQLGLDSFIFIDDSPTECAYINSLLPEVTTIQLPAMTDEIPFFLSHHWALDRFTVTQEDQKRSELYRQNLFRSRVRYESPSFNEFMRRLELNVHISRLQHNQTTRVAQLTFRTNQFNSSPSPKTSVQIAQSCNNKKLEWLVVDVKDRFGDYGIVGAISFSVRQASLYVSTFLLSCRALGKGVEYRMMARIGEMAQKESLDLIEIAYQPTDRNEPIRQFFQSISAKLIRNGNNSVYVISSEDASKVKYTPEAINSKIKTKNCVRTKKKASQYRAPSRILETIAYLSSHPVEMHKYIISKTRSDQTNRSHRKVDMPKTPTEELLSNIWSECLSLRNIGVYDNFFELGGHSLVAVQIMSRIFHYFNIELPLRAIFDSPTVAHLAKVIDDKIIAKCEPDDLETILNELENLSDIEAKTQMQQQRNIS